jgi:import inner membrane translocase subunit TIM44
MSKSAAALYEASEPIRQTEVYKAVAESVDNVLSDVKYGGFVEKDARRQRREARLRQIGRTDGMARRPKAPKMDANPESVRSL